MSIREIQEALPEKDRPAYTTVQTMVYRLEIKQALMAQLLEAGKLTPTDMQQADKTLRAQRSPVVKTIVHPCSV